MTSKLQSRGGNLQEPTAQQIQPDIQELLNEAFLASVRNTLEYQFGRMEAVRQMNMGAMSEVRTKMVPLAESFNFLLNKHFPDIKPTQIRLGLDYSANTPVALFVFPSGIKSRLKELRDAARALERAFWDIKQIEGMIWLLASDRPDQRSIETSFPVSKNIPA